MTALAAFTAQATYAISLSDAIKEVNAKAAQAGYQVAPLTPECFEVWYGSRREYNFQKSERDLFDLALSQGNLPTGVGFDTLQYPGSPGRIFITFDDRQGKTIVDGTTCESWEAQYLPELASTPPALDENQFSGKPALDDFKADFPSTVPVSIQEVTLSIAKYNKISQIPALEIQFQITRTNLTDLSQYFGTGYSALETERKLLDLLDSSTSRWISIREVFHGWPAKWANRFPAEMIDANGDSGNDVCFGVSRQFFRDQLADGGLDRSTEATEYMLKNSYRLLSDGVEPAFGDYLYLPGQHAIRFIMKDPNSKRWIGITAWSDSRTPYRLWWVDQDYQNPLSSSTIAPDPNFPKKMDIWRRVVPAK
jgi:hypothetical protein